MAKVTSKYAQAARDYFDSHPEAETALHEKYLDSLGISEGAAQHIVDNKLPDVAAHLGSNDKLRGSVQGMELRSQIDAIKKLHVDLVRGASGEADDNQRTDEYLQNRKAGR